MPPQGTGVTSLAVSPDGRVFCTSGTEGGVIRLWDTSLLGPIGQTRDSPAPSPPSRSTPTAGSWRSGATTAGFGSGKCPTRRPSVLHCGSTTPVQTVTFGEVLGNSRIGTTEGARWWDLTSGVVFDSDQGRDGRSIDRSSSRLEATAVSPDGRTLASARPVAAQAQLAAGSRSGTRPRGGFSGRRPINPTHYGSWPTAPTRVAPDLGARRRDGPGSGRAPSRPYRDSRPLCRSLDSPINQAVFSRDGGTCYWAVGMVRHGFGTWRAMWRSTPSTAFAMPTRSPPLPSIRNARDW